MNDLNWYFYIHQECFLINSNQGLLNKRYVDGKEITGPKKVINSHSKFQWLFGLTTKYQLQFLEYVKTGIYNIDQVKKRVGIFKVIYAN